MSCAASVLTLAAPSRPPARWRDTTLSSSSCKTCRNGVVLEGKVCRQRGAVRSRSRARACA